MSSNLISEKPYTFCNDPDDITREGTWLIFYNKVKFTYNQNLKGQFPEADNYDFKVKIATLDNYKRALTLKSKDYNRYTQVKLSVDYYSFNKEEIKKLKDKQERNAYVLVLVSNQDRMVVGNHREPMSLEVQDNIKDNGKGKDAYTLRINGKTTVRVRQEKLPEAVTSKFFSVLLYTNPIK